MHIRPSALLPFLLAAAASAQAPAPATSVDYRSIARHTDALLRKETGTRLELDDPPDSGKPFRNRTNRVTWNNSSLDQRVISIVVEPIAEESETTAVLTAALLVSVSAVDSFEEALRITNMVKQAQESDGRARMVKLNHGVRLFRAKADNEAAKYHIKL